MKLFHFLFALALLPGFAKAASAEWTLDGSANLAYQSNLSHAYDKAIRKADFSVSPALFVGHRYQLTDYSRFSLMAQCEGNVFTRYERLNMVYGNITASLTSKIGIGGYAPGTVLGDVPALLH